MEKKNKNAKDRNSKTPKVKTKRTIKLKPIAKVIIAVVCVIVLGGAATGGYFIYQSLKDNGPISTLRYETVRVDEIRATSSKAAPQSLNAASPFAAANLKAAPASAAENLDDENLPYYLADSFYDSDTYYYVYYLGYIKSVPIVSGTAIRYDGKTPINISFTKTSELSKSVTNSLSTAVENSTTKHREVNANVSATIGYKSNVTGFSASVTASVGCVFSWEYTNTRATTNTVERAETVMTGESFTISMTIGENEESTGIYRYSLFGTTDVYYVLELNKNMTYKDATTTLCARGDVAWGIDYSPDGNFGKTSNTENLVIPDDVDYTTLSVPSNELIGDPVDDPGANIIWTYTDIAIGWINATTQGASGEVVRGDKEIDDQKDKITSYDYTVEVSTGKSARYLELTLTYTVYEGGGKSNASILKLTFTKEIDLGHYGFVELYVTSSYQSVTGADPYNQNSSQTNLTRVAHGSADMYDLIQFLEVRVDGPGDDLDYEAIAFNANIRVWYQKNNT